MTETRNSGPEAPPSSRTAYVVLRREPGTNVLKATPRPQVFPDANSACMEAQKRASQTGGTFVVLQLIGGVTAPLKQYTSAQDGRAVGSVTEAIRATQASVDHSADAKPEILNRHGDVVGAFGIMAKRYTKPTSKRRSCVPIGYIEVSVHGCRARLSHTVGAGDLGHFRTATEAEAAILAATPLQPHPVNSPPAGSAHH